MRPLTFHGADNVYIYVSPDIEYLHGHHLVYAIVALLFTIVIVIGLLLMLAWEPFLNSKINFTKIKSLLDQFQGCYKDEYHYFAAYYMICRLVIITIIIANSSDDFIVRYLLITACVIMDLIHQIFKPYSNSLLNIFDGIILHFLVLVSVLPLVEFFDSFKTDLVVGIIFVIIILPSVIFTAMLLVINKRKVKKLLSKCSILKTFLRGYNPIPLNKFPPNENEEESSDEEEFYSVIDDSRRINATICDM